jgi:hypothetical protein
VWLVAECYGQEIKDDVMGVTCRRHLRDKHLKRRDHLPYLDIDRRTLYESDCTEPPRKRTGWRTVLNSATATEAIAASYGKGGCFFLNVYRSRS